MLFGIIGPAGAGKSTIARILVDEYGFQRLPFAEPLKRMLGPGGLGLPVEALYGNRKEEAFPLLSGHTARYAMQRLGTEWGRHCMGSDFWVNCWEQTFLRIPMRDLETGKKVHIVADDVRFSNEVEKIRNLGGKILQVTGRFANIDSQHASEKIPPCEDAIVIDNSQEMDWLKEQVEGIIAELQFRGAEV